MSTISEELFDVLAWRYIMSILTVQQRIHNFISVELADISRVPNEKKIFRGEIEPSPYIRYALLPGGSIAIIWKLNLLKFGP